ncbi:hypothetical protein AB7008_41660 [Bradyrhizobium sp. 521_C7_N1_3]|uniref:hypothetical protein n=1 Tax=Bradyrhizobium sp. 521_C7_N1_3 TaxID=3240368 RepID=UPI003F893124
MSKKAESNNGLGQSKITLADVSGREPRAAFTIKEFCEAHRLSEAMYYKIRAAGLGPREMRAMRKITISIEAAKDWRREREK